MLVQIYAQGKSFHPHTRSHHRNAHFYEAHWDQRVPENNAPVLKLITCEKNIALAILYSKNYVTGGIHNLVCSKRMKNY